MSAADSATSQGPLKVTTSPAAKRVKGFLLQAQTPNLELQSQQDWSNAVLKVATVNVR
jgi:hypothetical protein